MPEFRQLAKDVYAFLQPPLVCHSNAGVIIGERDVIVADSLVNAAMTRRLKAEIRRATDKPIRFLVNTHSHVDHVYTNHMFPEATVLASHLGREQTRANRKLQDQHAALFAKHFPEVDFEGGRYTLQDMSFSGSLCFGQGAREVRVLEMGPGHSESDVVVHLPEEKIVFCGDVFLNGMPPLPGEGAVARSIEQYRKIEALQAEIYVPGHGNPGTLADVLDQRTRLERLFERTRQCFDEGLCYDEALQAMADDVVPLDFQKMIILYSYWEFAGRRPESADPASQNHLALLAGVGAEAKRLFGGLETS